MGDNIEVSNLNRQFLFCQKYIGKSKAKIGERIIKNFIPNINLKGFQDNIKSSKFNSEYFKHFDIILNALDNLSARRHINRICVNLNKVFIESGTQGYIGQMFPIIPRKTECFECSPKETPPKYPVCTLRSYPTKLVHTIT